MKKLILLVSMIMTLAFSTMAFAAGDGTALNNEEKSAEKLLTAVTSQTATVESLNGIYLLKWLRRLTLLP
jgi:peptidoglycan hydrolase CwlO-like protein